MWKLDYKESWASKNWCFWTVVLEKTLESPLDCKEIQPVHFKGDRSWVFLEGMMLNLRFQYFGHLMRRVDSLEKTLMLGGIEGRRKRGQQRTRWLGGITDSMDVSLSELREMVMDREAWRAVIHGVEDSRTRLSDWTDLMLSCPLYQDEYILQVGHSPRPHDWLRHEHMSPAEPVGVFPGLRGVYPCKTQKFLFLLVLLRRHEVWAWSFQKPACSPWERARLENKVKSWELERWRQRSRDREADIPILLECLAQSCPLPTSHCPAEQTNALFSC